MTDPQALAPVSQVLPPATHPAWVYLARLAPGSFRSQKSALETVARRLTAGAAGMAFFPWGSLRYQHVAEARAWLGAEYAPKTANRHLSALRGVAREANLLGLMSAEDAERIRAVRNVPGGEALPTGRSLTPRELRTLFGTADPREGAILALLYGAGLRRAEASALTLADIELPTVHVLKGKGRKARDVPVPTWARQRLEAWIVVRGAWPGAFLCGYVRGRIQYRPIGPSSLYDALRRLAHRAGLKTRFSPHDLRRSWVSDMLDAGADLESIQKMAGHASPVTTSAYSRRGARAREAAAERLPDPGAEPK